jgi:uncharacterized protein DUF3221
MLVSMHRPPFLLLVLPLLVLLSCSVRSASEAPPATDPDLRGTVTRADLSAEPPAVLVEEKPEETTGSAKALVRLTEETRILRRVGDGVERAALEDLAVGQTVSVWFSGPVMESYPVQGTAAAVVMEGGDVAGTARADNQD